MKPLTRDLASWTAEVRRLVEIIRPNVEWQGRTPVGVTKPSGWAIADARAAVRRLRRRGRKRAREELKAVALGRYLDATVRTGAYCVYRPV